MQAEDPLLRDVEFARLADDGCPIHVPSSLTDPSEPRPPRIELREMSPADHVAIHESDTCRPMSSGASGL